MLIVLPLRLAREEAASASAAPFAMAPPDPEATCATIAQGDMVHVFDTSGLPGPPTYVNDHTVVQAQDGSWHMFGIFHREPIGVGDEIDFVHAVASERDPRNWGERAFEIAAAPWDVALRADRSAGETHLWAPHVVFFHERWFMLYQGGGPDDYHASFRLAESDDLYRWSRVGTGPLFEDFCAARDPMLVRRDDLFVLHYTRCDSVASKVSGVAYRTSRDLIHWSDPVMLAVFGETPPTSNSAYSESPFVFERGGRHFLSVTAYPIAWDATLVFRSLAPLAFPDAPASRLRAHAGEWIFDERGRAWLTHAGPGQRGVWISRIDGI